MFEMKLGEKFAELTADLDKLRKGKTIGKVWILNPFEIRYERDIKKWLTDLENFLVNDFKPPHTSYLSFTISSKENFRKEGQEYQDELNELADFLYHNGDKSDELLAELAKEKEMISKGESFYFQQIKNAPDKLIKNYLVEIIKVVELPEKSHGIAKSVGDFYQYLNTPELLELSNFSSHREHLYKDIPSLVDDFVKKIDKKYQINLQINLLLRSIRNDGWSNEYSYAIKKRKEVQEILNNFAYETAQDIERNLLSYEVLINLLPEFLSDAGGGQLRIFLTKRYEKEIKAKIETITNLEQAKETYREVAQYLHDLRRLAENHIELVNKELTDAKKILGEDITYLLTRPEEDFVQDSLSLEEFTETIRGQIQQIVESRATDNKEKEEVEEKSSEKEDQISLLEKSKNKIDKLNQELVEANEEKRKGDEKIGELVTKLGFIKNKCNDLSAELIEKDNEFQKITNEKNEIDRKLKESYESLESKNCELANERGKLATQKKNIEKLRRRYNGLLLQSNNWREKYKQENEKLQQVEQLNEELSQKNTTLEDDLVQVHFDFQQEREKVKNYETKLMAELAITDVKYWKDAVTSLKTRPEQAALDAANGKIITLLAEKNALEVEKRVLSEDLTNQEKEILQKFIVQLELKLKSGEITSTKVIQAIKELLGKVPSQETPLRSESKDQENQITDLNKMLAFTNFQNVELKNELTKSNKENTYLTSQNRQLQSQLSQKEKEKLLGIVFGVESGVVLTFIILSLVFKKRRKKSNLPSKKRLTNFSIF